MAAYDVGYVDIPGIMEGVAVAKQRRLQEMLLNRQMEREDREAERENKLQGVYARLRAPSKGGGQSSSGVGGGVQQSMMGVAPSPDMSVPSGSPLSPERVPSAPMSSPATTAPDPVMVQSWMDANQDVISELMMVAPDKAFALSESLSKLDDAQFKRVKEMNEVRGSVAMHLQSFGTPDARRAALNRIMPGLARMGITPELVQQELGDLSDAALQAPVALSMDVEKILAQQDKDRSFAETQRHNRAGEAVAQGRLGVAQGALGLAQKREGRLASGGGGIGDLSGMSDQALLDALGN